MALSTSWTGDRLFSARVDQDSDAGSMLGSTAYDTDNASLSHEDIMLGSETFEERRPRESMEIVEEQLGVLVDPQPLVIVDHERERSVTLDADTETPTVVVTAPQVPPKPPRPNSFKADARVSISLASVQRDLDLQPSTSTSKVEERTLLEGLGDDGFVNLDFTSGVHPHPEHYHECGDIVFQVQDQLFRLHSYLLKRESSGSMAQRASSDEPVSLNVSAQDFERFVRILYHPIYRPLFATSDDWISVLTLSTRWNFPLLREQAILQLSAIPLSPVQRIMLAQAHGISQWLLPAYVALCDREEPLTFAEGAEVGMKVVTLLAQARERVKLERKGLFKKVEVAKIVTEVMEKIALQDSQ